MPKSTLRQVLFLLTITRSDLLTGIRWYICISTVPSLENSVHLIHQDRFWFVRIPFGRMVKFESLAQFPVNHFLHLVVSSLTLFLREFSAFTHNMTYRFVSNHHITNYCYFVAPYLFSLWYSLSLWRCFVLLLYGIQLLSFLSFVYLYLCVISLVCRLKYP